MALVHSLAPALPVVLRSGLMSLLRAGAGMALTATSPAAFRETIPPASRAADRLVRTWHRDEAGHLVCAWHIVPH